MTHRNLITGCALFLLVIAGGLYAWANLYENARFAFAIDYPAEWESAKKPPPSNSDGVSFVLEKAVIISFSGRNMVRKSFDAEINENISYDVKDGKKLLKKEKTAVGQLKGYAVVMSGAGYRETFIYFDGGKIIYTCYMSAPPPLAEKYGPEFEKAVKTFRLKSPAAKP